MGFCIWSKSETTVKIATLVDVIYRRGDVDEVQSAEESEGLKCTVYESSIVLGIDRVSPECSSFRVLQ